MNIIFQHSSEISNVENILRSTKIGLEQSALDTDTGELDPQDTDSFLNVARDDEVNVIVVTGAGRAFCAGGDVGEMKTEPFASIFVRAHRLIHNMLEVEQPIIAALNGDTLALGATIATQLGWTPLIAFAFMVMSLIYVPCMATIAIIRRETNSWKWTGFVVSYTLVLGWIVATLIHQIGQLFF